MHVSHTERSLQKLKVLASQTPQESQQAALLVNAQLCSVSVVTFGFKRNSTEIGINYSSKIFSSCAFLKKIFTAQLTCDFAAH